MIEKRKLREEMKDLVKIGRKFVDREKVFKEKLQDLVRKKEKEKERRTKGKIGKRKKREKKR